MALGGSTYLKSATMLEQLLEEINFQRTKEMRQLMKDDCGFVVLQGTTYWTDLFVRHFLFQEEQSIDCDDLLFFVRKRHVKGSSRYLPKYETDVEVFRKDSKKLPIGDPEIDWEETVYLNLVVHQFEYTLTLAICTRTSPKELQVLKRHSQKVYASPSRRKMDTKGEGEEMTYPHICFMVDNFDEVFCDIVVRDGEMVCVELVARGRGCGAQAVIFLGSIRYDTLTRVYDSRQTSLSTKVAQRMSFGLLGGGAAARCEFVRMKGPAGKGHAEMAVSRPRGSGLDTPASEPGADLWDSDWEQDPEEMFMCRHQRRLSDPSANLTNFVRGGWRSKDGRDKSRSENEGLDSLVSGIAEVEAGDLRDARRGSASSWCCGRARAAADMREVYARPGAAHRASSPACLRTVAPRAAACRAAPGPPPLRPLPARPRRAPRAEPEDCEEAEDAAALDDDAILRSVERRILVSSKAAVRGHEELPYVDDSPPKEPYVFVDIFCRDHVDHMFVSPIFFLGLGILDVNMERAAVAFVLMFFRLSVMHLFSKCTYGPLDDRVAPPPAAACSSNVEAGTGGAACNSGARAYVTLPRRRAGVAAAMFRGSALPPHRTTPDGTDIYYWCDMPRRNTHELDDGAYNPLWAMRGFTQTYHLWKEGKRAQSAPLNAYLTYVTLPWWSIAKDILDHREEPILTF